MEEKRLLERIKIGHTEDFVYFVDKYSHEVFTMVARIVPKQLDAEEIAQDTFVKAFSHLDSYDQNSSTFSTWISRIAYNTAVSFLRKQRKTVLSVDEDEKLLSEITDTMVDETLSSTDENKVAMLEKALDLLSPDERTLILLFYYDGRSLSDISFILNIKPGNVATKLFRIRKKLYLIIKRLENGD